MMEVPTKMLEGCFLLPCLHCGRDNRAYAERIAKGKRPICANCKHVLVDEMDMPAMQKEAEETLLSILGPSETGKAGEFLDFEEEEEWI